MNERNIAGSNSLADLAARIRREHTSVGTALKNCLRHALAAGDLLIEAKARFTHGQWLPWLADHCNISERMAQRYMRLARNRVEIEAKSDIVSDLSIGGALALLTLPRETEEPSKRLTMAAIESLLNHQEVEDALRSLSETKKRRPLIEDAMALTDKLVELCTTQPALAVAANEKPAEDFAAEMEDACRAYGLAVFNDQYDVALQLALKVRDLASDELRRVESLKDRQPRRRQPSRPQFRNTRE
jgi:DUF3102 family protein